MITNDRQLEHTRRKLGRLNERIGEVERRLQERPDCGATRVTLQSYREFARQLQEEISRYELGQEPPSRSRLETEQQLQNTVAKLASLERLEEERAAEPVSSARNASLLSLRHTMNQLREEIAWYEANRRRPVESTAN